MSNDNGQHVGFVYGPPAVPFTSYANFQGALYPMFHATPPGTAHPHPGSPHAHGVGMAFPQAFIPVSPMAHRHYTADPSSPKSPHVLFPAPYMLGASPDSARRARAAPWGHPPTGPPLGGTLRLLYAPLLELPCNNAMTDSEQSAMRQTTCSRKGSATRAFVSCRPYLKSATL